MDLMIGEMIFEVWINLHEWGCPMWDSVDGWKVGWWVLKKKEKKLCFCLLLFIQIQGWIRAEATLKMGSWISLQF